MRQLRPKNRRKCIQESSIDSLTGRVRGVCRAPTSPEGLNRMHAIRYRLSRHVYLSVAARYCVFLDALRDRYLAVNREEFAALGPWLEGWIGLRGDNDSYASPCTRSEGLAADLCRQGILTTAECGGKPVVAQTIIPATKSATADRGRLRASEWLRHSIQFVSATARTRRQFKTQSFETIMRELSSRRERAGDALDVDIQYERQLVLIFDVCRVYYSRPFVCLFDSVCLFNFVSRYGFYPALVFGVIAEPFRAHCWLQEGDTVLNDSVERVLAYTPILCI